MPLQKYETANVVSAAKKMQSLEDKCENRSCKNEVASILQLKLKSLNGCVLTEVVNFFNLM